MAESDLRETTNADRLLPVQPLLSKHYRGEAFFANLDALMRAVLPVRSIEEKWDIATKPGVTYASLGCDLNTLHLYQLLIRIGGYKRVLELGTYIGVSTLFLAEAAGPRGCVTTVENGGEFFAIAARNIERNGYGTRVQMLQADALTALRSQPQCEYDFILIDAAKQDYDRMLMPALVCLRPGGLLLFDDVLMHGDMLNPRPSLDKSAGVRKMLDMVASRRDSLSSVLLPIGNGLLLIRPQEAA